MKEQIKKLCEALATKILAKEKFDTNVIDEYFITYRTRANPDIESVNVMTDEEMLKYCKSQFTEKELKEIL